MYTFIGFIIIGVSIYLFGWIIKPIHYIPGLIIGIITGLMLNMYENDIMASIALFFLFIYPIIVTISRHRYIDGVKDIRTPYPITCPKCNKETLHISYTKTNKGGINKYYCINSCYNDNCRYYNYSTISRSDWIEEVKFWKIKHSD